MTHAAGVHTLCNLLLSTCVCTYVHSVSLLLVLIYVLTGPPDDITDVSISPDACSFVVQWNNTSSDPVCGSVWYTVTISTEGGMLIITDNTTVTNYSVTGLDNITGLNNITVCNVNVTASNNVGSSGSAGMSHMINTGKFIILYALIFIEH